MSIENTPSQRWANGQHSWRRPSDGGFDQTRFDAVSLPESIARQFVERHHYAGTFPAARFSYGLTTDDDRLAIDGTLVDGRALVGVAVLSVPMSAKALTKVFPDLEPNQETLELGRLVLTDTPANAESWFLRRVFDDVNSRGLRGVVSFSDPMPRRRTVIDEDGNESVHTVTPGHAGVVYQSLNALALGRSTARTLTYLPKHGIVLSDRMLQKIRAGESGADSAERRLVALGASPRPAGVTTRTWLPKALDSLSVSKIKHPGNFRYAWALGTPAQRRRTRIGMEQTRYPKPASDLMTAA